MPNLNDTITRAAAAFAKAILAAVKGATLQELLAMQGEAPTAPAMRRGRPPKAKAGRKPGRPAKATAKAKPGRKPGRPAKATVKKITKKVAWPTCKHRGCKKNAWRRGDGYCGEHFRASKAG